MAAREEYTYTSGQNSGVVEAYFTEKIERERKKKRLGGLLLRLSLTAVLVYTLFGVLGGIAIVQGASMEPSVSSQSVILFYRLDSTYAAEDIVLLEAQGQTVIKRVVATAGDTVDIDSDSGALIVNGEEEQLLSAVGQTFSRGDTEYPITVPRGYVFVLGDNREDSVDSRDFGLVSVSGLIGKALFMIRGF